MATRTLTASQIDPRARSVVWTGLLNTDDGSPWEFFAGGAERTVQVNGTFGSGGTCVIEGSLDGTNFYTIKDPDGAALSFTAGDVRTVREYTRFLRPRVTAGDGATSLTATLFVGV